jgi:hypothetical protein
MSLAVDHLDLPLDVPLGLCLDCNYPLHGLPTPRCPECGREFDPANPTSMNMGRELTPLMKWVLGPIRNTVRLASWAAIVVALWYARLPGQRVRSSASIYVLILLGTLWLTWPILRTFMGRRFGWPTSLLLNGQRQRFLVGIALLLSAVAIWYQLPLKLAMYISQPAMDRMAREVMDSGQPYGKNRWVGIYPARRIKAVPGGVRFTTEDSDVTYKAGFIYLPNVDPKKTNWKSYKYVGGGWWTWREEG